MKQKLLTLFMWMMSGGTKALNPKDEGQGVILSVFTSCGLGFGYSVSSDVLDAAVDKLRKGKYD